MTTPQAGAYDDIVKAAYKNGIPVATTNSFDGGIYDRLGISHTGQDASAAAIAGTALVQCLIDKGVTKGSIVIPSDTAMGNIEVNNRVTAAFNATVAGLKAAGTLDNFKVDAGPENVGVQTDMNDPVNGIVSLIESRGDVVGAFAAERGIHAGAGQGGRPAQDDRQDLLVRLRPWAGPAGGMKSGDLTGSLGQQPFIQGFWPVMQLYLQIDRGISAANVDTRAQLVTKENVGNVGKRFEN